MTDPVRLGSALFTLVEPHRGHEVAYNRWYERDHFYAGCMVGPWLFAGRRWVATRALKDLRTGSEADVFGDRDLGSYLAIYWIIEGRHDDHTAWALQQVHGLHAAGRMFAERDHVHTLLYRFTKAVSSEVDGVPPELALDHPYEGLVAALVPRGAPLDEPRGGLRLEFEPIPLPDDAPVSQVGLDDLDRKALQLTFLDHAPEADDVPADGVLWGAPFIPTVPGTDRYTDELW